MKSRCGLLQAGALIILSGLLFACSNTTTDVTLANVSITQVQKRVASDIAAGDRYGSAVAISGDVAVVGAPYSAGSISTGIGQGAAYVLYRNQGGTDNWGQVMKLTASDGANNDQFGSSVAISGDAIIVGAPGNGSSQGAAYIFSRNSGTTDNWGEVKKLTASDHAAGDGFGVVAISGTTAVVGAPRKAGGDANEGAAYIFYQDPLDVTIWTQVRKVVAPVAQGGANFGQAAAISADVACIGSPGKDVTTGNAEGAAYVLYRNDGGADMWGVRHTLSASGSTVFDGFGTSVSISGDVVIAGAPQMSGAGYASVFSRNRGGAENWGEVTRLTALDGEAGGQFGQSVAISGDVAVVGAVTSPISTGRGTAYAFSRNIGGDDSWGQFDKLIASDAQNNDNFGASVALSGNTAMVGSPGEDGGAGDPFPDAGAVYLFSN